MPERTALILLVSSQPVDRSLVEDVLYKAGYAVLSTGDLGNASDMVADPPVDLLIIHPHIDNIPGHEAAKFLREKNPHMAVLVVAGLLDDDRIEIRAKLQDFEIFPPPYTAAQLVAKVDDILARRQPPPRN